MREPGFYWVKRRGSWLNDYKPGPWEPAEFHGDEARYMPWSILGSEVEHNDEDFTVISYRIEEPQW